MHPSLGGGIIFLSLDIGVYMAPDASSTLKLIMSFHLRKCKLECRKRTNWRIPFVKKLGLDFWIGDVIIPIITLVVGFFAGKTFERKAKAKVKGDNNTVIQNSNIGRRKR